jgi:iron complex outermembrane receptor protein
LGTAISPVSRYSFNLQGSFDLTPSNQVYGTLLINQRESSQVQSGQVFGIVDPGNPFNPGFGYPLPVVPYNIYTSQRVNYERLVLGFKGDLPSFGPLNNWTYDVYGQLSNSDGMYTQTYVKTDRINATMGASAGTNGCDVNAVANPGSLSMAQAEPGVACVPVNYFAAVVNGGFTPAEQNFLFSEGVGHTNYKQYYLEGSTSGDVFELPAGPLGASIGFHVRREDLDDVPGADFVNANVYNYSTSGITKGSEEAQEVFGELEIPVIKNFPLIHRLNVNLSGRVSNYSDYGTNETYKLGVDWDVTSWLTFRATQGTAFRAPALYEQYLANQTSFLGQLSIDPCINYGTSGASQNVQKNCASQGIPSNYAGNGSSAEIFQGGGKDLKPETSLDQTAGIVFQPKWFGLDLKIAATYFSFDIKNQIQNYGSANILYQCYDAPNFPSNPFCSLFQRDLNPSSSTYQQILTVNDDFVNVAEQFEQGMDLDVHYSTRLPKSIKFTLESHMSWSFFTSTDLLGGQTNNYLTQVGQPVFVGNVDFRFDRGPWTFNYYLDMVGHSSDDRFVSSYDSNYLGTGENVFLNHVVPFYSTSDISLRRKFDKFTIEVGVKNLYDTTPPVYSSEGFQSRLGTVPLASQYDIIGRSYFVSLDAKF